MDWLGLTLQERVQSHFATVKLLAVEMRRQGHDSQVDTGGLGVSCGGRHPELLKSQSMYFILTCVLRRLLD